MSKTLYLHIGMPKTGTTAIQFFCRDNMELLEKKYGLYYPEAGRITCEIVSRACHWDLALPHHLPQYLAPEAWAALADELKEHDKADIIISNEALFWLFHPIRFGSAAFEKISEYCPGYDIKIIFYIRRYDDWFKSLYNQLLKREGENKFLYDRFRYGEYLGGVIDGLGVYNTVMAECRKVLPPENFIRRFYDPAKLKNGNIIDDFFDIFQLELQDVPRGGRTNEKLPDSILPLLASLFGLKTNPETEVQLQKLIVANFTAEKSAEAAQRLNQGAIKSGGI